MVRKLIVNNPAQNNQLDTTKTSEQTEKCESRMMSCTTPELSNVNIKLEKLKEKILRDIEKNVNAVIDEIKQDISRMELDRDEFQSFNNTSFDDKENKPKKWENQGESFTNSSFYKNLNASDARNVFKAESTLSHTNKTHKQRKHLSKKIFEERESYLTVLLQIPHMKTIYHIFYIILLVFLLNSICYDYFVEGRVNFGLGTFQTGFDKLDIVLIILVFENLFVISLYYAVKGWSRIRNRLNAQKIFQNFWSKSCLTMYIGSQLTFAYVASAMCIKLHLPFVTASVLLLESTRLLMKMHAFVRVNVERLTSIKLTKENEDEKIAHCSKNTLNSMPPFSSYIYFLFAPTLVYKDNYPRTNHIRWKFALNRLLEVIAIAFLYSYIHERYIRVHFGNYGLEPLNASAILVKLFGMIMPSIIIFLCGFYLILHSWLNFTSELLRFGDRMFYKDWWTSVNYDAYFRNWNVVVHDWLYEYIYKDCYNHIFKGSKLAASIMVFMVSALVHEHILAFALQIFFPVMFLFFGVVGVGCVFLTRKLPKTFGNIFLWFSLIFGNSLMVSLYCMEYYANQNCPKQYSSWLNYFIPASWNCYNS